MHKPSSHKILDMFNKIIYHLLISWALICGGVTAEDEEFHGQSTILSMAIENFKVPDMATFRAQAYATLNCYRRYHQVPPVKASSKLESQALDWANHLASTNGFEHSSSAGSKYGETLYADGNPNMDGTSPMKAWYSESRDYNYQSITGDYTRTGHFTQMVWKSTTSCGISYRKSVKWTIVVAVYSPPGNGIGQYRNNVLPPSGRKPDCVAEGLAAGKVGSDQDFVGDMTNSSAAEDPSKHGIHGNQYISSTTPNKTEGVACKGSSVMIEGTNNSPCHTVPLNTSDTQPRISPFHTKINVEVGNCNCKRRHC